MIDWIVLHKIMLQWALFILLIFATALQLLLNMANQREADKFRNGVNKSHGEMQLSLNKLSDKFDELKKVENLERFLQDIKIDSLKKYVAERDIVTLQKLLEEFSLDLKNKDVISLKQVVANIRKIIPCDPYFRVFGILLQGNLIEEYFADKFKIVQIIHWDWVVEGDESAKLYVSTYDMEDNPVTYGPFTNNTISMLDNPIRKAVQIRVESSGKGRFSYYPRSFRIGWAIAEKNIDGSFTLEPGLAEYEPLFRIGLDGNLEY